MTPIFEARKGAATEYIASLTQTVDGSSLLVYTQQNFYAKEADYLTMAFENVCVSYVCRYPDCRFYGANSDWAACTNVYHFRCPRCGRLYQPFVVQHKAKTLLPCQKVLSIVDTEAGKFWAIPAIWAADGCRRLLVEKCSR